MVRRWLSKAGVKVGGPTIRLPLRLVDLSVWEVGGLRGVAVKCIDSAQNAESEGS